MASTTASPEILSRLFSDSVERFELVDGELQPKPMVSIYHALITTWLGHLLLQQVEQFADEDLWVLVDPLAKIREDHWRRPDIAVISAEHGEPWKYVMPGHWPLLCVEILSPPDQTVDELIEKCRLYHAQGVKYCWVIAPESRTAWTYHQGSEPIWVQVDGSLDAGPIIIKLSELWTGLKNKRGNRTLDRVGIADFASARVPI